MKQFTFLSLFFLVPFSSLVAQEISTSVPKLIIVIPNGQIGENLTTEETPKFLFTNGSEFGKTLKRPEELSSLRVVIYDKMNSSNNKEILFDQSQLMNEKLVFEYKGDQYEILGGNQKLKLVKKVARGPASGSSQIKVKVENSSTPIECSNHDPGHRYYDGDPIRNDCCFYNGCSG